MKKIKTIVFDLGGVLVDLHIDRFKQSFLELGISDVKDHFLDGKMKELFRDYEMGMISTDSFLSIILQLSKPGVSLEHIRFTWSSMLDNFTDDKVELLKKLRQDYQLFLLSNTNEMHWEYVVQSIFREKGCEVSDLFDKVYLSYEMHDYKPNVSIFKQMIEDSGVNPAETLFIDDRLENVEGAREAGLQSICVETSVLKSDGIFEKPAHYWVDYLPEWLKSSC